MTSFVCHVLAEAQAIENGRTAFDIIEHTMSELGELSEEIVIAGGRSYKAPGPDGVAGEALDVALCLVDLLRMTAREDISGLATAYVATALDEEGGDIRTELRALLIALGTAARDIEGHGMSTGLLLQALVRAIRIVRLAEPGMTDARLTAMAAPKLEKWAGTAAALADGGR
ncbi:hypothetical protein OCH239_09690 [Roseivivax halodurans JCM 10272]|uniref:Uncharacterized protein n=1 Tax=Roseivivax halodurans JCM 10272 TaxID=1449350 RepID=X7EEA4_9RHOB|nr:hypothetical protein [Roseivivax halodurans]ETX13541.1 hypothetical protein OCH239_09690 [Roseivivax halodurans JCM 10272]